MCDKACAASQKEFELIKLQREAQREKLEFFSRNSRSPEEKLENMCETKPSRFETDSHFQQQERSHRRQNTERSQHGYWKWPMYASEARHPQVSQIPRNQQFIATSQTTQRPVRGPVEMVASGLSPERKLPATPPRFHDIQRQW